MIHYFLFPYFTIIIEKENMQVLYKMSIATLKRKTQAKYNNMSVGSQTGFSLNGTLRSQGWVGQTMLSRSLPKTNMRGNTARGYGGCCGNYNITPIVQSAVTSLNDTTVVKPSTMNTSGMIEEKYMPYHNWTTVKQDSRQNTNTQQDQINKVAKNALNDYSTCDYLYSLSKLDQSIIDNLPNDVQVQIHNLPTDTYDPCKYTASCKTLRTILRPTFTRINTGIHTKPESTYVAVASSTYLDHYKAACAQNVKAFPKTINGGVLPGPPASY